MAMMMMILDVPLIISLATASLILALNARSDMLYRTVAYPNLLVHIILLGSMAWFTVIYVIIPSVESGSPMVDMTASALVIMTAAFVMCAACHITGAAARGDTYTWFTLVFLVPHIALYVIVAGAVLGGLSTMAANLIYCKGMRLPLRTRISSRPFTGQAHCRPLLKKRRKGRKPAYGEPVIHLIPMLAYTAFGWPAVLWVLWAAGLIKMPS